MKTLYVSRPLLNADKFIKWAKEHGFDKTLEPGDVHVTIAFSKSKVDWDKFTPNTTNLVVRGGDRTVEPLGSDGAIVMKFESDALKARWLEFLKDGCSWDFPSYQPHISITYFDKGTELKDIGAYPGELVFGPETFKEVDLKWKFKVKER